MLDNFQGLSRWAGPHLVSAARNADQTTNAKLASPVPIIPNEPATWFDLTAFRKINTHTICRDHPPGSRRYTTTTVTQQMVISDPRSDMSDPWRVSCLC